MPTSDLELDACEIVEFFLRLAEQDAALVAEMLSAAGLEPGTGLPTDTLFKLAVYCRLALWEEAGLVGADDDLPSAASVFMDAVDELEGKSSRLELLPLCRRVHWFALRRLTWPQTSNSSTFLFDDQANTSDALDSVAELLWNFRHLAGPAAAPLAITRQARDSSATNEGS
jgi:hypothetical protein